MLHLYFGLNFESLAEDLMDKLKDNWVDPFRPPVILFPDLALEQWFKLKWVEKYGVLANLNTQFLDKFLFESLVGKPQDGLVKKVRLSSGLLQNLILAWLQKKGADGQENWQTLCDDAENNEVRKYIQSADGSNRADESRLYDFAGKMAWLYMEYETSRPGKFKTPIGLIETWKTSEDAVFFARGNQKSKLGREAWQRKLYRKLFVDDGGVMEEINRAIAEQHLDFEYITLPQLYELYKQQKVVFRGASELPVFVFWHAGMGQFYRVALQAYAKVHDVYAYIQNPCMEFWEDVIDEKPRFQHRLLCEGEYHPEESDEQRTDQPDNPLLVKWGRGGRDNIKLWCESAEYDFIFHDKKDVVEAQDTLLHQIQYSVSHRENFVTIHCFDRDKSLTVNCAPSKIREVEHLHTKICQLLQGGANIRDILVVAPNINDYRTAIHQIFAAERTQVEFWRSKDYQGLTTYESDGALYIPFTIIDGEPRESHTARALQTIFRICSSQSLNRLDFFELVRNPLVQNVRGIDSDEVSAWEGWLLAMNVYRDRDIPDENCVIPYDDWNIGIRRLLLARMTDGRVEVSEDEYVRPFADLNSQDDESLCRFIDAVKSLEDLCSHCKYTFTDGLTADMIRNIFIPWLNSWIASDDIPKSMAFEQIIYKNVMDSMDSIQYQFAAGLDRITLDCLKQTLIGASETSNYTVGTLFVNGLTFMNFLPNRIIPIKHLFFLGLDAAGYPGRDIQNSLDLRTGDMWPGDNQNAVKNRYAFLCQMMSTSESLHLSYVNKNLQKDEDFFPSSVINDLMKFAGCGEKWDPTPIDLDEKRPPEELFTRRSMRNHDLYQCMIHAESGLQSSAYYDNEKTPCFDKNSLPERVTLSRIKAYLNDPFQFRMGELMQKDIDDVDPEKMLYEPVDVDAVELLGIIMDVAQLFIRKDPRYIDLYIKQTGNKADIPDELKKLMPNQVEDCIQSLVKNYMNALREQGVRMASMYENLIEEKILDGALHVSEEMIKGELVYADNDNTIDVTITQPLPDGSELKWQLQGTAQWHVWGEMQELTVTSVALGYPSKFCYRYLTAYTSALALIVQKAETECWNMNSPVNVCLYLCFTQGSSGLKTFSVSPKDARNKLIQIYQYAYIDQYAQAAPMEILEDCLNIKTKKTESPVQKFDDLVVKLSDSMYGPWRYFKKGKIFDLRTDIGYDSYDHKHFIMQWNEARRKQLGLVDLLEPKADSLCADAKNAD